MGSGDAILIGLRVLVVVIALGSVALGAWSKVINHDIEVRGSLILNTIDFKPTNMVNVWRRFFSNTLANNQLEVLIAMGAGCFTSATSIFILLSLMIHRMRIPTFILLPLEFLAMLSMGTAFGAIMSLVMKFPSSIDTASSPDLESWAMLLPLTRAYAIATGSCMFLLIITSITSLIKAVHRLRDSKACSFEPTASSLGIDHSYQAVAPRTSRGPVPTMYDPAKPLDAHIADEEKGLVGAGAEMGRRESRQSQTEMEVSWPIGVRKPEEAVQKRPSRPWSEIPDRR